MATIKELKANREKLRKYDELKEWKERFEKAETPLFSNEESSVSFCVQNGDTAKGAMSIYTEHIPDHIKAIIVNALQAEIGKIEEE